MQLKIDRFLFYKGSILYELYTDDSIFVAWTVKHIEQVIVDIRAIGLDVSDEGDIGDFLGVHVEMKTYSSMYMTQPHLIHNIIIDMRLEKYNGKKKFQHDQM